MFEQIKIEILVRRLKSKSKRKVEKARALLIRMEPKSIVPSLLKHISLCDWERHHIECLRTISSICSPALVPCLLYRLRTADNSSDKIAIAIALGAIGNRDAVSPLVKLLSQRHNLIFLEMRRVSPGSYATLDQFMATRFTIRELVETGNLVSWLSMLQTAYSVWVAIIIALGDIGDQRAVAILEETLDDWSARPLFAEFHADDLKDLQRHDQLGLFMIGAQAGVVHSQMGDTLRSLAKIGGVRAREVIQRYSEHEVKDVRNYAVEALQSCSAPAKWKLADETFSPLTEIVLDDAQDSLDIRKTASSPRGHSRCPECGYEFDTSANIIDPPEEEEMSEEARVFLPGIMNLLDGEGYSMPHLRCPKCKTTWMEQAQKGPPA